MEYCLNGFGLVIVIVSIKYAYQIVNSSITGKPLDKEIEEFITGPTILYATGGFTFGSAYGIYMEITTGELGAIAGPSFLYLLIIVFIFSAILFYGGVTRIFKKKKP